MIKHYLELAWQQLEKYRLQSVVSIVSLGIGFACFALAAMWIKYETTFDAFHEDAEEIYVVTEGSTIFQLQQTVTPEQLDQFPEISEHCLFAEIKYDSINGRFMKVTERLLRDDKFLKFFRMELIEGHDGFLHDETQVAISDRLARELWGEESPIGKELTCNTKVKEQRRRIVTGVFKDWGKHTNFPMDLMSKHPELPFHELSKFGLYNTRMIRLHPNAKADTLRNKLESVEHHPLFTPGIVPIKELREYRIEQSPLSNFKPDHIYLFAIASLLLIACGLLNYLTMFIHRLFIRKREIALRTTFGATGRDIMVQFLTEYGLLIVVALFVGFWMIAACQKEFLHMTGLPMQAYYIYQEMAIYSSFVIFVSLLLSAPAISYFRRQSLHGSIAGVNNMVHYNTFRRVSTGIQICIAIFCIFCVAVMMKQLDTLRHEDIGFKRENRGSLKITEQNWSLKHSQTNEICDYLKQQPEIDIVFHTDWPVFPSGGFIVESFSPKDFPQLDNEEVFCEYLVDEQFAEFYELTLLQGRWLRPEDGGLHVLVNETAARRLGWDNVIGLGFPYTRTNVVNGKVVQSTKSRTVVGVFKDMLLSPTERAKCWKVRFSPGMYQSPTIMFKFKPGTWPTVKKKILDLYAKNAWETPTLCTFEESYDQMLVSEDRLHKLLSITTGVCILIALFGVWSMIMLTCEQRRKEIAVRKVFGATVKDILDMFIVEYMALQAVAALVAFPIGYACMKPWLEQYVVQTEIPWWIYVGIFLMVALLVALCVGWRVWKTATAHPADEICKG